MEGRKTSLNSTQSAELAEGDSIPDPFDIILCEYHTIPEGVPVKLYAGSLSCKHGLRWANQDKKATAREIYEENEGFPLSRFAQYAGVTRQTAKEYVKDILAKFESSKKAVVTQLHLLGWTQEEISIKLQELWPEAKGTSQQSIAAFLPEMSDLTKLVENDLAKGYAPADIARTHRLPELVIWNQKLAEMDDQRKLDALGIKLQPYDVWNFQSCHDLFGAKHPGRIPGELIAHVLYFFTEPGERVIDPMVGSGTTLDVAKRMGRRVWASDLTPFTPNLPVHQHDILRAGRTGRRRGALRMRQAKIYLIIRSASSQLVLNVAHATDLSASASDHCE